MACESGSVVQAQAAVVFWGGILYRRRTECCPFSRVDSVGILPLQEGQNAVRFSP